MSETNQRAESTEDGPEEKRAAAVCFAAVRGTHFRWRGLGMFGFAAEGAEIEEGPEIGGSEGGRWWRLGMLDLSLI